MSISHRKGYKTVAEAEGSQAFRRTPGATIDTDCACGLVHVNMMGSAFTPRRPQAPPENPGRQAGLHPRDNIGYSTATRDD
jgi:hypothetical protein